VIIKKRENEKENPQRPLSHVQQVGESLKPLPTVKHLIFPQAYEPGMPGEKRPVTKWHGSTLILGIYILAGCKWLMHVILATWEAEIGSFVVQGQPGKIVHETPSPK
jgi:hypothetical protein